MTRDEAGTLSHGEQSEELERRAEDAFNNGTPMIPLHRDTVKMLADMIKKPIYPPICGYPLRGWQLGFVKYDDAKYGQPNGWLVKLQREYPNWAKHRREYNVMARSDVGPLEAWEEAIRVARRCDERAR